MALPAAIIGGAAIGGLAGYLGGDKAADATRDAANMNYHTQKEFAQHGIRWKVEDAKAAGIHPLAALGAQTHSFAPSYVGATQKGEAIASAGQNIGRAIASTSTAEERMYQKQMANEQLKNAQLQNELLSSQITRINHSLNPPMAGSQSFIPGQGDSGGTQAGLIKNSPMERTMSHPDAKWSEPGATPEVGWAYTSSGGLAPVPSRDVKERIEDSPAEYIHTYRNQLRPNFGSGPKPPKSALPKGADYWKWSHSEQAYFPAKHSRTEKLKKRFFDNSPNPYLRPRR